MSRVYLRNLFRDCGVGPLFDGLGFLRAAGLGAMKLGDGCLRRLQVISFPGAVALFCWEDAERKAILVAALLRMLMACQASCTYSWLGSIVLGARRVTST